MSLKREIPTERDVAIRIGSNDANNSFDSSLVTGNANGSVLERLEDVKENISGETNDLIGTYTGDGGVHYNDSVKAAIELLSKFIASGDGDMADGTPVPSNKSLYDALIGGIDAVNRVAGKLQIYSIDITAAANAELDSTIAYVLEGDVALESVVIFANSQQSEDLISCPVFAEPNKRVTLIDDTLAIQANLNASEEQVAWGAGNGVAIVPIEARLVMEHNGGGSGALDLTVVVLYRALTDGAYLNPMVVPR